MQPPSRIKAQLSFIVLEIVVADHLEKYIDFLAIHDKYQSAYRRNHSTETALVLVKPDTMDTLDEGKLVFLMVLDQRSVLML